MRGGALGGRRVWDGRRPRRGAAGVVLLLAVLPRLADGQITDRAALVSALDSAAAAHAAHEMVAGLSVAVVRGADTLLMKGYGFADLEWDVPTPEDASASYEIGSVTKQFTAAALLTLVEEGAVDLDADVTEYLPDFDTQGRAVPVARLLDHTSGIKGYTEMRAFGRIAALPLPRDTLLRLVESEPFDFEPGTALIYNNTAYFLLGLIIEEVTGKKYEEVIQERLFGPAGMDDSYYCSTFAVRKGRAHGYDGSPQGLIRKRFLDHRWPYAAGSLCSTVGDLVAWNQALHGGRLLSPEAYAALTTPRPLVDGTPVRYAMGLLVDERGGRRIITHGGGINGYLSDARYLPDDELLIVALQNSTGPQGPGRLVAALQELVLGPDPEPVAAPYEGDLSELAGTYTGPARGRPLTVTVSVEEGAMVVTPQGAQEGMKPMHLGNGVWGDGRTRAWFVREDGRVVEMRLDQGSGHYVLRRQGQGEGEAAR